MLVIDDHVLHCLQTDVNDVVDIVEALLGLLTAYSLFQVKPQMVEGPLAAMLVVVAGSLLCDGHVGQMNEHVVSLLKIVVVLLNAKTGKTQFVQIDLHGFEIRDKNINSEVEFFAAYQ